MQGGLQLDPADHGKSDCFERADVGRRHRGLRRILAEVRVPAAQRTSAADRVRPAHRPDWLYVSPDFEGYEGLMKKLGKYRAGNSCIHIKRLADVDLPTLKKLIRKSVDSVGKN